MLIAEKLKNFNVNKSLIYTLPEVFKIYFCDLDTKVNSLIKKYTPARLHNSRVAARRMETLFIGFQDVINNSDYKYGYDFALDSIKKLIKTLGSSREFEVSYNLTLKYIKSDNSKNHKVLLFFLNDLRINKNLILKELYKNKYFIKYPENLKRINKYIDKSLLFNVSVEKLIKSFRETYCEIIFKYFNSFIKKTKKLKLFDLGNVKKISPEKLHQLRIDTKTFRYLLDLCSGFFTEKFESFREVVKNIVEKLGEYHDLVVVIDCSQNFLIDKIPFINLPSKSLTNYLNYSIRKKDDVLSEIVNLINSIDDNLITDVKNLDIFKSF